MKTSDYIAQLLAQKGARHIFAISGAGNLHLLDSIARHPGLRYICPHHEQAGVMASLAYGRISGRPGIMLTTSGGGSSNAVTGVLDAWADSIPCLVIAGQEKSVYIKKHCGLRMWGVQGFDSLRMVENICKYAARIVDPLTAGYYFEKALYLMKEGRPGPVWLEFPIDIQAALIDPKKMLKFQPASPVVTQRGTAVIKLCSALEKASRPVILLGHGIRLAGGGDLLPELFRTFKVPFLTSWTAADMMSSRHPQYFGHEGIYGQRCANFVVQNSDLLIAIGSRLAIPQVGYEFTQFARQAHKIIVDIDASELGKFSGYARTETLQADAREFLEKLLKTMHGKTLVAPPEWLSRCRDWRRRYPLFEKEIYCSRSGYVNSYRFIDQLSGSFGPRDIIVTDMGTALTCTHQIISLRQRQRLITSLGLGEMGFGLPGAIGACFASGKKRIILVSGDGSIMMNLQEMQTVAHHRLPIKIFLYSNDGYLSIKHTQAGIFGERFSGSGKKSGVSCPDFRKIARAFGFSFYKIEADDRIRPVVQKVLERPGPVICEIKMDPRQPLVPKTSFSVKANGAMVSPPLEDLYPFLSLQQLEKEMIVGLHKESRLVRDVRTGKLRR